MPQHHTTRCDALSPDAEQIICVLSRNHTGDHRGVQWIEDTVPADYYWPHVGGGRHRLPVPSHTGDALGASMVTDYSPRHRATETRSA